tara:strand:+ start:184 stop:924 length:741 start_codon:yes stop_codon:yes gene_type:complete
MGNIWIHRHIHKTGGTSIRQLFLSLANAYLVSMHHSHKCTSVLNNSMETRIRVFEMHEHCLTFNTDILPTLLQLRVSIKVVLTTFIREPFEHSISSWIWAGKPSFGQFNRTISYWLPWNMQSNQLLHGDFDPFFRGNKEPSGTVYRMFNDDQFHSLLHILSHYDIVCPTNMMIMCTQHILKELDLPAMPIDHIAPEHHRLTGKPLNHTAAILLECRNINCSELVANRTKYDRQLFEYAQHSVQLFL